MAETGDAGRSSAATNRYGIAVSGSRFIEQGEIGMTGATQARWPDKTRELHNHHMKSTVWNDFTFRDDDIVIATYAKSGTTWM